MTPDEQTASATIVVRRRAPLSQVEGSAGPLTSDQLGDRVGAHPDDVAAVREAALGAGLRVVAEHASSRRVRVEGPADTVRAWVAQTPASLRDVVTAILGSEPPQAFPRSLVALPHALAVSYTPLQLAQVYGMPQADGSGQTIAIIELGGGFDQSDLDSYFSGLGLATPHVTSVGVDGGKNQPGQDPAGADLEVLLDIEVAGAIAPKADVVVYFAPNTDAGFLDAVSAAAHADPAPTAMSISWGQSEDEWTAQARTALDNAFADAVAMGVTVTAAAGDNGSSDKDTSGSGAHTDFPASSPHVLGCGGTSLHAADGRVASETVWDDGGRGGATGGGVSDTFPLPSWQQDAGVPQRAGGGTGRGVPDVAADADPQTGYQVLVDGTQQVVGGTSAVAPLWAGLIARIVQLSGTRVGLAQTGLYAGVAPTTASPHLRDITQGSNGAYAAGPEWDPCTGLGVPDPDTAPALSTGAVARARRRSS
ncbi:MAG TPA: S53 family peptidase [Segeticoccus sp.]|uniref:S53 family peptidase n=1 Tax=Segeticoccus sp. TaxID=2706531 RepID=UPI002D7E3A2C|nr:S53 family peptidase [Segeticoccus sp.]HET8598887.1 S53 family peptidase [Segeticoccus sp.]